MILWIMKNVDGTAKYDTNNKPIWLRGTKMHIMGRKRYIVLDRFWRIITHYQHGLHTTEMTPFLTLLINTTRSIKIIMGNWKSIFRKRFKKSIFKSYSVLIR